MRLGELCNICSGGTPKRSVAEYWNDGTIPWVKISDISNKYVAETEEHITEVGLNGSSAKMLDSGTLLYSIFASIGAVGILEMPAATNQAIAALSIKAESVDRDYLYHFLKSREVLAKSAGRGAAQNNINLTILREMMVPVPSAIVQELIVGQLETVLNQIESTKDQLESLDALVKSRFAEMFGDPAENTMSWDSISLTSLGSCKNGMSFKSRESGIELPCLGVGDFKDRAFINGVSEMGRVSLDSMPAEDFFLRDGDIVFVRSNGNKELVGRCLAVFPNGEKAVYSGFCIRLRVESDQVRVPYLIWALRHPSMRRQMFGRGANVQNLNQKLMANVMIPIPPLSRQDCFLDFVSQVDKSRFVVRNKSQL